VSADRRRDRDAGFTLTEMLVVIMLFTMIGAAITTTVVSGLRHQTTLQDRSQAIAGARTALERVDRDLRAADPLMAVSANQLVMSEVPNENAPTATRQITYSVIAAGTSNELVVDEVDTSTTGVVTTKPRRVLLTNLVNGAANPIFSYVSSTETVTVSFAVQPSTLKGAVTVSDEGTTLRNPPQ
jgi:prepilin-type N-terminal cleavage/methylation domain-containing protein